MKRICLLILIFGFSLCNAQSWQWGRQGQLVGDKAIANCYVATDVAGNAFLTGNFGIDAGDSIIFSNDTLIDWGYNLYFVKYNSAGTVLWAQQFGSQFYWEYPNSIITDVSNNVIISGNFNGSIGIGPYNLDGAAGMNFFIAKFDNNGKALWALADSIVYPNTNYAYFYGSAADKLKNIFVTGTFNGTMLLGGVRLVVAGTAANTFIEKLDSNGKVLWAKNSISKYNCGSNAVTADKAGNTYITGNFKGSTAFGSSTINCLTDVENVFIVKYDPAGNVLWARESATPSLNNIGMGISIITDSIGNVYIDGIYNDTITFGSYTLVGGGNYFVKYDANGNVKWAKNIPSGGGVLASDECDNIYMSGNGVIKFDTSGNVICSSVLMPYLFTPLNIATDKTGNYVYVANVFANDSLFCGPDTLISYGNDDPFVIRWKNCSVCSNAESINALTDRIDEISIFPNPTTGIFTIQSSMVSGQSSVEIYNIMGQKMLTKILRSAKDGKVIDLSNQPNGIYLYRVIKADGSLLGEGKVVLEK